MEYRFEAKSIEGFVQMLASNYLPHGYWFYVTGRIPDGKSAESIDRKILAKYGIELSRQQRSRRKLQGLANLHYLRFERFFVILATHGKHQFYEAEGTSVKDIRKVPLQFRGYSLSVKRGGFLKREVGEVEATADKRHRVRVLISREAFRNLAGHLLDLATHRTAETLRWEFWNQPFEPYAPVRRQFATLHRAVNRALSIGGREPIHARTLRWHRTRRKSLAGPSATGGA